MSKALSALYDESFEDYDGVYDALVDKKSCIYFWRILR